jgi:hypothetical protein
MLLLKTKRTFQEVLANAFTPLVILPASRPGETRDEGKARANDLAVTARIAGLGVTVVESTVGELFVLASSDESQTVGFARKMLRESKTGEPWFLFLRKEAGPLLKEMSDRTREDCTLTITGFGVDGRTVEMVAAYVPAQNNTAMMHHRGFNVGEHL